MRHSTDRHPLSPAMKMADLMDIDFSLLGVLSRMGLSFGFGEETVEEVCRKANLDPETFLLICRVYAFDGYTPTQDALARIDLKDIVKYLHLSHAYYMDVALKALADTLERMIQPCDTKLQKIIWRFFSDYKDELAKHFAYEEDLVFPHVMAVLSRQGDDAFTMGEYEENHSNVEEKLDDLKSLVMRYMPPQCDQQDIYKALFYIFALEKDLEKHTLIEDDILVPVVGRMESHE